MEVKLKVLVGKNAGVELRVPVGKFFIGRADDCQLKPKSDLISRHHCVIMAEDDFVAVRDLGSRNGTHVNDARVAGECELRAGDRLRVGPLEFEIVIVQKSKKHPRVTSIKEAAVRTVAGANADELDAVGDWLGDDAGTPVPGVQPDDVTRIQNLPDVQQESLETEEISLGNTSIVLPPASVQETQPTVTSVSLPPVPPEPAPAQAPVDLAQTLTGQAIPDPTAVPQAAVPPVATPQAVAPAAEAPPAAPAPVVESPQIPEFDLPEPAEDASDASKFVPRMAELKPFQPDSTPSDVEVDTDSPKAKEQSGKKEKAGKKTKTQPAKLPPMPKASSGDTKSAAEDTLRRLFRRR